MLHVQFVHQTVYRQKTIRSSVMNKNYRCLLSLLHTITIQNTIRLFKSQIKHSM